ncbi:hypothetical protein [Bacillus niameyensis]|uniref:hypothetical protein n=1 Tax=Bacillus niameyensis TaxID=1522308 RepID=UPI0007862DDC|nr:hypothetical protein [Bacillus niameyensis]
MAHAFKKTPPNVHILKLTFFFFGSGIFLFLTAMIAAIWLFPELVQLQSVRNPKGWLLAHLFLLGWATMVAMGASYQITQVVLRTSLYSRAIGYIHFFLYLISFIALLAGFLTDYKWIAFGGGGLTIAIILYIFNVMMTFIRKKEWNVYVFGVSLSLLALLLTVFLGMAMGFVFGFGWNSEWHELFLIGHLWFGIGGWLSALIIVYSFKLLPMFLISRKKPSRSAYWIIGIFHLGVWIKALSALLDVTWVDIIATICFFLSLLYFIVYIFDILKLRVSKRPIGTVKIAFILLPISFISFVIWSIEGDQPFLTEAFIMVIVLGLFTGSILSYLAKIIPFLWWPYRYSTKETRKEAVLLGDMLPERRMTWELAGYLLGIMLVITGFMIKNASLTVTGQIIAVLSVVTYLIELTRTFRY